ncbi:MAG: hypothetical protein QXN39_04340, partial [Archaeoglobaceae archaeon]
MSAKRKSYGIDGDAEKLVLDISEEKEETPLLIKPLKKREKPKGSAEPILKKEDAKQFLNKDANFVMALEFNPDEIFDEALEA